MRYADESGDCGMPSDGSPTRYFCLSGVVVHELRWLDTIKELIGFRHWIKRKYGVYLDAEIHAAHMINKPGNVDQSIGKLKKHERLAIIRHFADRISTLVDVRIINVVVDKQNKPPDKDEVFRWAWYSLFQRFENTIRCRNFPGPKNPNERGIVFPDNTDGEKLKRFLNDMRENNLLEIQQRNGAFTYKNEPIQVVIEDPVLRDSRDSYLIQAADCAAYLLKQHIEPSSYMKKHGGNAYLHRLASVLCTHASYKDPRGLGIVCI
ncbi:MAG: DUF3800 domain-containing protein [Pirellulaceae bacterium]|nr:DUF3800 domain-containing protein [Pirellulaceae bacterium]